nr:hypothetical protein OG781_06555 [Streptomyces sp. NBC_00830]
MNRRTRPTKGPLFGWDRPVQPKRNFPFSSGRTPGKVDNDEFIAIRISHRPDADKRAFI